MTTITLTPDVFENDVFIYTVGTDKYLRFYILNEDYNTSSGSVGVHRVLCELIEQTDDGFVGYALPNIVGMSNKVFGISSESLELQGAVLTSENMAFCTMEYYDA
jgi:hypothetical protein